VPLNKEAYKTVKNSLCILQLL